MNEKLLPIILIDALMFLLGAFVHLGIPIPLGVVTWAEPVVIGAAVVEGVGAVLLISTVLTYSFGKGPSTVIARVALWYCFFGVLWGMVFLALKTVPQADTVTNDFLHIGMILMTTLALVFSKSNNAKSAQSEP